MFNFLMDVFQIWKFISQYGILNIFLIGLYFKILLKLSYLLKIFPSWHNFS